MASMFENQYKLLARSENKVQEVGFASFIDNPTELDHDTLVLPNLKISCF